MANTTVIQIRLPDEELAEVQKRAKAAGLAPAAWAKNLIYKELELPPLGPAKAKAIAKKVVDAGKPKKAAKKATKAKKKVAAPTSPQPVEGTVDIDPDKPPRRTMSIATSPNGNFDVVSDKATCAHPKDTLKKFSWGAVCGVCSTRVR